MRIFLAKRRALERSSLLAARGRGRLQFVERTKFYHSAPWSLFGHDFWPIVELTLGREELEVVMPSWARGRVGGVRLETLALPLLLVVAAALRLSDLNWDSGHLFHPDERHILMVTDGLRVPWPLDVDLLLSRESPLNPKSFAYGSLIFYLLKFLQWVALGL